MALFVAQFLIALLLSGSLGSGLPTGQQARSGEAICWIDWGVARERQAVVKAVWRSCPTGTGSDQLVVPGMSAKVAAPRGGLSRASVASGLGSAPPPVDA